MPSKLNYIFITDTKRADIFGTCNALPKGSFVILRDYDLKAREREELGLKLKKICKRRGLKFLVAKDFELAVKLNADGIHLPEFAAKNIPLIRLKKPRWIITASAHNSKSIFDSLKKGACYVLLSPIFKTESHPEINATTPIKARNMAKNMVNRVYGLGGISQNNVKTLQTLEFAGVAGISGIKNCVLPATVSAAKGTK